MQGSLQALAASAPARPSLRAGAHRQCRWVQDARHWKSTLLRALARLIRPISGRVTLGGKDIHAEDTRALARRIAILPQSLLAPDGILVVDLVKRGRTPWRGFLAPWSAADAEACAEALAAVDMQSEARRPHRKIARASLTDL